MASKLFILCLFAIVFIGYIVADDYEGDTGDDGGEHVEGGYDGGDYESDGGEGGDYQADQGQQQQQETDDDAAAAAAASDDFSHLLHPKTLYRHKRSLNTDDSKRVLRRVRRGGKGGGRVGPVYTYQKTDHHGNFKWGARHMVDGGHGW